MFCRFCGKEIQAGSSFCMNCGRPVQNVASPVQNRIPPVQNRIPPVQNTAPALPMNWFKFIVYFQLFFVAVIMLANGVNSVMGILYDSDSYFYYSDVWIIDVLYGILCLFFAGLAIFVQQWLIRYKTNAWVLYLFYVGITNIVNLLYLIVIGLIVGQSIVYLASNVIGVLIVPSVYIPLNYVYFNKRKHLFVN